MSSDLKRQRLHPFSLPFSFIAHAKGFLIPIALFLLVKNDESSWEIWAALFLIPTMIVETWRYMSLRYWIEDDELIVKQGVIQKTERHVPLARIQTIDSTQNFLERLFGVVEVRVETAGSGDAEAHLKVLSLKARDELRRKVFTGRSEAATAAKAAAGEAGSEPLTAGASAASHEDQRESDFEPLARVSVKELILLGLSPGRGLAILAGLIGIATQFQILSDEDYALLYDWTQTNMASEILMDVAIGLVLLGLVFGLSVMSVFLRLFDFRLDRRGSEFRTQCGLFTRHSTTIPAGRIQFVSIQASPALRIFKKRLIKIRTAGARGKGDGAALTRQWLLPVVAEERVPKLVRSLVPGCDFQGEQQIDWQPLAQGAARRSARKAFVGGLLVCTPAAILWSSWGSSVLPWIAPLFLVLIPLYEWLAARAFGWAHTDFGLVTREGVFGKRMALVPSSRVQTVAVGASPFDRRWRMARLEVDTAGTRIGHRARIPYLERPVAEALAEVLTRNAEASSKNTGPYRRLAAT
ncbi:MAG: PH domain-containing protein [Planctomycetota bacterium]|nr:PH domain-containing protein [Planctomycetota bacterium]